MKLYDERLAAYHEAGHAIVAYRLKLHISCFTLEVTEGKWDGEGHTSWTGSVDVPAVYCSDTPKEYVAQVAFAGALSRSTAECAYYYAEKRGKDVASVLPEMRIDDDSLPRILDALLAAWRDDDDMTIDDDTTTVKGKFRDDPIEVEVDFSTAGGDMDLIAPRFRGCPERGLLGPLWKTKALIDDPAVWTAVIKLANRVLGMKAKKVVLRRQCLDEALQQAFSS